MINEQAEAIVRLSPPHVTEADKLAVSAALQSGWAAPVGPNLQLFEQAASGLVGRRYGVALNSGTAALHLGLKVLGLRPGDFVLVPTETFAASAFPVVYEGATPVFVDSDEYGNMDPECADWAIREIRKVGGHVQVAVVVDLFGTPANYEELLPLFDQHEIRVLEDSAEGLGSSHRNGPAGSFGDVSILSFNGNKIVTTSGGGMLLTNVGEFAETALKLATQAREDFPWYEHSLIGYNYRLSNILAALGNSQLKRIDALVEKRRLIREWYREYLSSIPNLAVGTDPLWGESNAWLTVLRYTGVSSTDIPAHLRQELWLRNIESRPTWKPMHQQPVFSSSKHFLTGQADNNFRRGLCLPSGVTLTRENVEGISAIISEAMDGLAR